MAVMPSRWFTLFVLGLTLAVTNIAYGQVAPTQISQKLLNKSMDEVLGSHQNPEWRSVSLSGLDKKSLELRQKNTLPDSLFVGKVQTGDGNYWIIPDIAPSKSETFSFVLYLTDEKEIYDVDVLKYRENYGYEIDYSFFRKQFQGKKDPGEVRFGRSIQNISGATISARSITHAVHDLLSIINSIELEK